MRGIQRETIQDECGRGENLGTMRIRECVDDTTTHLTGCEEEGMHE